MKKCILAIIIALIFTLTTAVTVFAWPNGGPIGPPEPDPPTGGRSLDIVLEVDPPPTVVEYDVE